MDLGEGTSSTPIVVRDTNSNGNGNGNVSNESQPDMDVGQNEQKPIVINMPSDETGAKRKTNPNSETILEHYFGDLAEDILFIAIFILFNLKFVTQLVAPLVPIVSIGGDPTFLSVLIRAILARMTMHGIKYLLAAIS